MVYPAYSVAVFPTWCSILLTRRSKMVWARIAKFALQEIKPRYLFTKNDRQTSSYSNQSVHFARYIPDIHFVQTVHLLQYSRYLLARQSFQLLRDTLCLQWIRCIQHRQYPQYHQYLQCIQSLQCNLFTSFTLLADRLKSSKLYIFTRHGRLTWLFWEGSG